MHVLHHVDQLCSRKSRKIVVWLNALMLLLVAFVVPSRIRGADAFTHHHLWLIDSRCNHCERQRKHQCQLTRRHYRGRNHLVVYPSAFFLSSTAVENKHIIYDNSEDDENSNSIDTRSKKETQNTNYDNSNIRPHLRQLLKLCRPINFPVIVILHLLGVHQSVQLYQKTHHITAAATTSSKSLFVTLVKDPAMLMVLLSLLLVSSTSMITNDYYDAREGVDSPHDSRHPLAAAVAAAAAATKLPHPGNSTTITDIVIPLSVAKYFTKCLYAILLLSSAFVPSIMARILVLGGAMITYLYTVHLKPITWIKNISCAALVALGPITSGCAAWHVLRSNSVIGSADVILPWFCILQSPLSFLVISLFFGIMGREVLMDIIDCVGDARASIETISVRYGKRIAANVALVCSILSSMSACVMPLWVLCSRMLMTTRGGESPLGLNTGGTPTLITIVTKLEARRLLLSLVGSGMLLRRVYDVWWSNGEDNTLVNRAVDESLLSVLLVLASFL